MRIIKCFQRTWWTFASSVQFKSLHAFARGRKWIVKLVQFWWTRDARWCCILTHKTFNTITLLSCWIEFLVYFTRLQTFIWNWASSITRNTVASSLPIPRNRQCLINIALILKKHTLTLAVHWVRRQTNTVTMLILHKIICTLANPFSKYSIPRTTCTLSYVWT